MMLNNRIHILFFAVTLLILPFDANCIDFANYLPDSTDLRGWKVIETRIVRTDGELFNYMDGGAELYRAFNFRKLAMREFEAPDYETSLGSGSLVVEIFMFSRPEDAFGLFSLLPVNETAAMGDGGGYSDGVLNFWKGPYFCRITFRGGEWEFYKEKIMKAGSSVDRKIDAHGSPPSLLKLMPDEGLRNNGLHYFYEYIAQRNLYYITSYNLLNLNRDTRAVLGEYYTVKAEEAKLLLIKYPDEKSCSNAYYAVVCKYLKANLPADNNYHLKKQLESTLMVEVDRLDEYLLIGFEEIHSQLLSDRFRQLKNNLLNQVNR
jgi:hypothetical protein